MISINQIKQLREETGLSIMECRKALIEAEGDFEKAKKILKDWGKKFAEKKEEKETGEGLIESYIHSNKRIGAMVELRCESDFVARSKEFQKLAHELCLQITAISPKEVPLLEQLWIRDETKKIKDLIEEHIAKFGENIIIKKFVRYKI
jgi:elongation factor Ts